MMLLFILPRYYVCKRIKSICTLYSIDKRVDMGGGKAF